MLEKTNVLQSKGQNQFQISQETHIEAIIFARHLFGEINN